MARLVIVRRKCDAPSSDEPVVRQQLHFDEKSLAEAVKAMYRKESATGRAKQIIPLSKTEVDRLLERTGVEVVNKGNLDYVYVANMAKADFWRSSIEDEHHLALYIKDVMDDVDAPEGSVFLKWIAAKTGNPDV